MSPGIWHWACCCGGGLGVGTGFLVAAANADGKPVVITITDGGSLDYEHLNPSDYDSGYNVFFPACVQSGEWSFLYQGTGRMIKQAIGTTLGGWGYGDVKESGTQLYASSDFYHGGYHQPHRLLSHKDGPYYAVIPVTGYGPYSQFRMDGVADWVYSHQSPSDTQEEGRAIHQVSKLPWICHGDAYDTYDLVFQESSSPEEIAEAGTIGDWARCSAMVGLSDGRMVAIVRDTIAGVTLLPMRLVVRSTSGTYSSVDVPVDGDYDYVNPHEAAVAVIDSSHEIIHVVYSAVRYYTSPQEYNCRHLIIDANTWAQTTHSICAREDLNWYGSMGFTTTGTPYVLPWSAYPDGSQLTIYVCDGSGYRTVTTDYSGGFRYVPYAAHSPY